MSLSGIAPNNNVAAYTAPMQQPTKAPKPLPTTDSVSFSDQAQQLAKAADIQAAQKTNVEKTNDKLYGMA
jgi:hypothetical protein